ncbi:MAG: hypothetical protein AB2672_14415, partial [Candidatus Thiodiazotropha endolucinida]
SEGKGVITHPGAVWGPGGRGAGYIMFDPGAGVGAYKGRGGSKGGWSDLPGDLASVLVYLSNADDFSKSFKFLANFAGTWFGIVGDFVDILNTEGCGVGDAIGGAVLTSIIGSYLTNLSFVLVAGILNPLVLLISVFIIIQAINFATSLIKSGVIHACRTR